PVRPPPPASEQNQRGFDRLCRIAGSLAQFTQFGEQPIASGFDRGDLAPRIRRRSRLLRREESWAPLDWHERSGLGAGIRENDKPKDGTGGAGNRTRNLRGCLCKFCVNTPISGCSASEIRHSRSPPPARR